MIRLPRIQLLGFACVALSMIAGALNADARLVGVTLLVLLVPGALLGRVLGWNERATWAAWPGLGIALIALIYEWASTLGLAIRAPIPEVLVAILLSALCWQLLRLDGQRSVSIGWVGALLIGILAISAGLRFYQIRDLALPNWVDSLHHALLIRVVSETGQSPLSLRPYLPVDQLPYHWGYHVMSAFTLQAAHVELSSGLARGMLLQGQVIGALVVVAYAGLAEYLWRRPFAAVLSALIVGLISVMPAYYLSWGRYTLLCGLLTLPAVLICAEQVLRVATPRAIIGFGVALAGLSLVHFVVFVFGLAWCVALVLGSAPTVRRPTIGFAGWPLRRFGPLAVFGLGGGLAVLLTLPWLMLLISRARIGAGAAATYVSGNAAYNAMPFELLWASNNRVLLLAAAVAALIGGLRRSRVTALIVIWSASVLLLANPTVVRLPYLSFVTNETVAICVFVPAALLIGGGGAYMWDRLQAFAVGWQRGFARVIITVGIVGLAGWGVWEWRSIVRFDTILANADDLAAAEWVAMHTPLDARFLVNTTGWLGDVDRGADGGWWLLPLAGRQVSTPPVLYTYAADSDVVAIKQVTAWLRAGDHSAAEIAGFMHAHGFSYIYAVQGGHLLSPERLGASGLFTLRYTHGRVTIMELR